MPAMRSNQWLAQIGVEAIRDIGGVNRLGHFRHGGPGLAGGAIRLHSLRQRGPVAGAFIHRPQYRAPEFVREELADATLNGNIRKQPPQFGRILAARGRAPETG